MGCARQCDERARMLAVHVPRPSPSTVSNARAQFNAEEEIRTQSIACGKEATQMLK